MIKEGDDSEITVLIKTGFLNEPKKFGEIIKELKNQAKFVPKKNYTKTLQAFVRGNKLQRKSSHKQWVYSKK